MNDGFKEEKRGLWVDSRKIFKRIADRKAKDRCELKHWSKMHLTK